MFLPVVSSAPVTVHQSVFLLVYLLPPFRSMHRYFALNIYLASVKARLPSAYLNSCISQSTAPCTVISTEGFPIYDFRLLMFTFIPYCLTTLLVSSIITWNLSSVLVDTARLSAKRSLHSPPTLITSFILFKVSYIIAAAKTVINYMQRL